jgi:V8-like Glu-specific endopeptidase
MPRLYRFFQHALGRTILLCVLVGASLVYVAVAHQYLYTTFFGSTSDVVEHQLDTTPSAELQYWTAARMSSAIDADTVTGATDTSAYTQEQNATAGTAAQEQGQPPTNSNVKDYPLSTIGKIFFSDGSGTNYVCSGTAIVSNNHNTFDTAGHCLYMYGSWSRNVIFVPLYDRGSMPYGRWAATQLVIPKDWENDASTNDLHHDMGEAVVASNDAGNLTDVVGGAGWAYNVTASQPFYAYGYPAGAPFDGQTRQSCANGDKGTVWEHGGGQVVSIPCNMTGGSSGGGWFVKSGNQWYLNGHNDFTSTIKRGHMFSPYYDDTWYAIYNTAQNL